MHWMIGVVSPRSGIVFWLDPTGAREDGLCAHAKKIIDEGIQIFFLVHRTDIKQLKKNPEVKWTYRECSRQAIDAKSYAYYVCRYMLETIQSRQQIIPDQYIHGAPSTYSQEDIDEVQGLWITYVNEHKYQNLANDMEDVEDDYA